MQRWFDNSSVRPPEPSRRLWSRDEEEMFLRRVGFSDAVAVGSARLVTMHTMLGSPRRIALAFSAEEVIYGDLDPLTDDQGDLMLPIISGDVDFQLALRVIDYLPGSRYLRLLEERPTGAGKELRWSLYRPDRPLLEELRAMFRWLEKRKKED